MFKLLSRKASIWLAVIGILSMIFMIWKTTSTPVMPHPPIDPAKKPYEHGVAASGIIEAIKENTNVGVPAAALVKEIKVKVWDKVSAGAVLFYLDDRELQARLRTQESDLLVRQAELARTRRLFDRAQPLIATRGISQEEADNRKDDYDIASARVSLAQATVAETRDLIDRLAIRSPIDATILQVNTRAGEYVTTNSALPPMVLGSLAELQVRAEVDEQIAPRVKADKRAIAYLKGDTTKAFQLEFLRIEPYVIPKRNLTGLSAERVDTRVLQVIYKVSDLNAPNLYVGQQVDLFIEE